MKRRSMAKAEIAVIVIFACIPLFVKLPFRVNIFLSWEGAFRMSQGQLPFRDFGVPLGGFYWVVPAIFFKVFGAKLITLVKAQVFLNMLAGLSFYSILCSFNVQRSVRFASVVLFCISYSFFNFWPWYNHSVIVYELLGLAFICRYINPGDAEVPGKSDGKWFVWARLVAGAFFLVCSLLTKQDAGGIGFFIALVLLSAYGGYMRTWRPLMVFVAAYLVIACLFIVPLSRFGFGYWFNHGQPPHTARVSPFDVANSFFGESSWLKFYLFMLAVLALVRYRTKAAFVKDRRTVLLLLLTFCVLGEAAIFQVTSYTPPDNNIFFHSFAFPCLFALMTPWTGVVLTGRWPAVLLSAGILLWWSTNWWKYTQRITSRMLPHTERGKSVTGENVVNKDTYILSLDTVREPSMDQWVECGLPSFSRIYMPPATAAGIQRLMGTNLVRNGHGELRVLNMSELTPLAADMPYRLERNGQLPLWYHLGVGMFNRQADSFDVRIRQQHYDLVLFEYIPTLNNFYPFRLRDSLRLHYQQVDSFPAPRRGPETRGWIEVFVR